MRIYGMLLLLAAQPVCAAEFYADVGLGHMWGSTLELETPAKALQEPAAPPPERGGPKESAGPHATAEIGYAFGGASIFVLHASSVASGRDKGVNVVGVKYRFSVKVP